MLLTMEHAYLQAGEPMPNQERIDKVDISMENLVRVPPSLSLSLSRCLAVIHDEFLPRELRRRLSASATAPTTSWRSEDQARSRGRSWRDPSA